MKVTHGPCCECGLTFRTTKDLQKHIDNAKRYEKAHAKERKRK